MKVLANDGISKSGIQALEKNGFEVITTKVAQEQVANFINAHDVKVLLVRSATKVRKDIIDACPGLKIIGRGGVGMDNIDVDYAKSKGLHVINTPASSSESVAELVFAHLFTGVRFLQDANRNMPLEGDTNFDGLKKAYANGTELRGKTIGIIGFGRIGQELASLALGCGMIVLASDPFVKSAVIQIPIAGLEKIPQVKITCCGKDQIFQESDIISLHVPGGQVIGHDEIRRMKKGVVLLNASRGGVINEHALLNGLESGQIAAAGLDVFENEPSPSTTILQHPKVSLTPHIGASTKEAQERIGKELAESIVSAWDKLSE